MYEKRIIKPAGYFPREGVRAYSAWPAPAAYGFGGGAVPLRVGPLCAFESTGEDEAPPTPPTIVTSRTSWEWLRSDLLVTPGITTQGVASWTDNVNAANILAQGTTGAQPTYTNPDAAVNNRPSLLGDGAAKWLEDNTSALAAQLSGNNTPFCAYFVIRTGATLPGEYFCAFESTTVSGRSVMTFGTTTNQWNVGRVNDASAGGTAAGGVVAANTTYLVRVYMNASAQVTLIANGVTAFTNAATSSSGVITMDRQCLFAHRQGGGAAGAFFLGKVLEVYFCSGTGAPIEEPALISYFQSLYPGVS